MVGARSRRARTLIALAAAALTMPAALSAPASAAVAPPSVTSVKVRGTQTPSEVVISWKAPVSSEYAGARVVVVPGRRPTSNVSDPAAVLVQDVAAPSTSFTWSTGTAGHAYVVSVFSYAANASVFGVPATARAALPGSVRHLTFTDSYRHRTAYFAPAPQSDESMLCMRVDRPPTTPTDAMKCSEAADLPPSLDIDPDLPAYFSVFAIDSATGAVGPPVSEGDGKLPVVPTEWFEVQPINDATLDVQWTHDGPPRAIGPGGNVSWELLAISGVRSPVGNRAAKRFVIPVRGARNYGTTEYQKYRRRFSNLVPHAAYTFAIRGVDADGDTTPWDLDVGAGATPGIYVGVAERGAAARVRRLPVPRGSKDPLFAVEPNGTAHVGVDDGDEDTGPTSYGVVPVGAAWRSAGLPAGVTVDREAGVSVATSPTKSSVVAMSDDECIYMRGSRPWDSVECIDTYESPYGPDRNVLGLVLDRRNKVHVVWLAEDGGRTVLRYGTNAAGAWTTRDVTSHSVFGVADLTYDRVTDRLVLVTGDFNEKMTRYRLRIASKSSRAAAFEPSATTSDADSSRAIVPRSVASHGGRITVAASRINYKTDGRTEWGTPVLLSGMTPASVGGMTSITGASPYSEVRVVATPSGEVLVGYANPWFDPRQGIWTLTRNYSAKPTWGKATRHTPSGYDHLKGLALDAAGRLHLLFERQ